MQKRLLATLAISVCLSSCGTPASTPNPPASVTLPQRIAQTVLDLAKATNTAESTIISLQSSGQLTLADAKLALAVCAKVNTFTSQASALLRGTQPNSSLLALINPLLSTLSSDISDSVINIKDANTKSSVQLILLGLQTTISIIQVNLS